jgi:GMP synthase (glutamine-hydrolysing)
MRVLSIVHDASPTGGGGLFEQVAVERGDVLDRWVTTNGAAPVDPEAWDGVMVFGGVMHPDEDAEHPWLADELRFIGRALENGVPLLGVCLGSQLIARAAGATVRPADAAEVGWCSVDLTDAGVADPLLGVLPRRVDAFQWHYYTFDLPTGAVELASSPAARQAFRLGDRAWGIQFHAEVERQMLEAWFGEGREELGKPLDAVWAETNRHLDAWNRHGRALCTAFLSEAARVAEGQASAGRSGSRDHSCQEPR